ncbi:MAG TPA: protein kinase [Pyrinomonadaceae bacterium]
MLAPNTILQNRYRIVRQLGQGGMGAIYEAIDQRVSCVVALKETFVGSDSHLREAFHREAALLANLRHPALPKVMDYFGEGDGEFLIMEFIIGHDLLELLALRGGPLPQVEVLNWGIELLKVLEYLHTHEPPILHRDIKPANLKATKDGELFLLDFGLAKGATGQMLTVETNKSVPGYTPIYAPLEQILGQGTDPRSDVYAVGATLYHLLIGQAPVPAPTRFNASENNQPDPLRPMNQVNIEIAPEVSTCIQKAMAVSVRDRTESARMMRLELEHAMRMIVDRDIAQKAEQALHNNSPERDPAKPLIVDEGVQFTVYAPEKIRPEKNYSLLAFAHLTKRRDDADPDEPDPLEEVKKQAARLLGEQQEDYRDTKDSSEQPVPRGGELTIVPVIKGITFNPPSRSFTWRKSVHREEFDLIASDAVDGQTLRGSMTVFLGSVVIADVRLTISVDSLATAANERISLEQARTARRVRQVFASYSRKDEQVVAELAHVAPLFGTRFLLDRTHLEPGEDRVEGVQRLIRDADVFQLFWSTNSMRTPEIADEIRYAIALGRPGFILPTYWEEPVPRSPAEGLPPPEIDRLQFYRIYPGALFQTIRTAAIEQTTRGTAASVITQSASAMPVETVADYPNEQPSPPVTESLANPQYPPVTEPLTAPEPTISAAPSRSNSNVGQEIPGTVTCAVCGTLSRADLNFCNNCGNSLHQASAVRTSAPPPMSFSPPPTPTFSPPPTATRQMSVVKHKSAMMKPIFAAAAMVLLVIVIAPVWFVLNQRTSRNPAVANKNSDANPPTIGAAPNPTGTKANTNTDYELAPDGQFVRVDGKRMRLRDFRGRFVLLNLWSTTSVSSREEILVLNELQKKYAPLGLTVIGLAKADTAESVRQFQRQVPQDYVVGVGGREIEAQLSSTALPTSYMIDRRGRVRKKLVGPQSRESFEATIAALLKEQP